MVEVLCLCRGEIDLTGIALVRGENESSFIFLPLLVRSFDVGYFALDVSSARVIILAVRFGRGPTMKIGNWRPRVAIIRGIREKKANGLRGWCTMKRSPD